MAAQKRSVSGPSELFTAADKRWPDIPRVRNFSQYVQHLIEKDIKRRRVGKVAAKVVRRLDHRPLGESTQQ